MFDFVIKYFGFLKLIPGLPHLFETWLNIHTFMTRPLLLDRIDTITNELAQWDNVKVGTHKYGGTQFNCKGKEIGHIHGNGLLDMLLSRKIKQQLMLDGRIQHHHHFKDTGWISFYIHSDDDRFYAVRLLRMAYDRITAS